MDGFRFFCVVDLALGGLVPHPKIMWPSQLDQNDRYIAQADDPQYAFVYKRRTTCRKVSRAEALAMGQLEPDPWAGCPMWRLGT